MIRLVKHDAVPRRLWCGPAVIAAVTGLPTSRVYAMADQQRAARIARHGWMKGRHRPVKGMGHGEVADVLRAAGYDIQRSQVWEASGGRADCSLTLEQFIRRSWRTDHTYIVATRSHYLAVRGLIVYDNRRGRPTWWQDRDDHMRSRLRWVVRVVRAER